MPRVLMNFQRRDGWHVHFIEADCKTTIGSAEALALHIAQENWDTPEQLQFISDLRIRYERLADDLRIATAVFRWLGA